jgi:hypothetical protein
MMLLRWTIKLGLLLALFTCIGQVPLKGFSLEMRYHRFVNSSQFQHFFWTTLKPVTWTSEKVAYLVERVRSKPLSSPRGYEAR